MAYTMHEITWHTQCANIRSSIHNAMKWNGIHNAQWTYTNMSGPQPHSQQWPLDENETLEVRARMHANRGPILRHKCHSNKAWQGMKHDMQTCKFQYQNMMQNSPETWKHGTRCMKWDPKLETRHMEWLIAIQSMHYLIMKYKERAKAVLKHEHF